MTMTDVNIGSSARPARSPDTRAAINYLIASGATAIGITEFDGACTFRVGNPFAVVVFWITATEAKHVVKLARKIAGPAPDIATATASLQEAASSRRSTLTANAIERAQNAVAKLDAYLHGPGVLREFNRGYKAHRAAAAARGQGYMPYTTAMSRLRLALVPLLIRGRTTIGPVPSLFKEIFDR